MIKTYHFTWINSTNDYARMLVEKEPEIIVTSDHQSMGRGRKDRSWYGEFGKNLYFSYAINHQLKKGFENNISYLCSATIISLNALKEFAPKIDFRIKYPNDIYAFDGSKFKKICGILSEHIYQGNEPIISIIGIGINLMQSSFPDELKDIATSLYLLGYETNVNKFQEYMISEYNNLYSTSEQQWFEIWRTNLKIKNKEIILIANNSKWKVKDILPDGRLHLINDKEEKFIDDGESVRYDLD